MQNYEYKVKVTTAATFSEDEISAWLNATTGKGWRLISSTFFGQGMMWIFGRERVFGAPEDPEVLDENSES